MKSIEVIVPRLLVKKHYPHPEFYGESIVQLKKGMVTDIYTNEDGYLFTITNDENLIEYLQENYVDDKNLFINLNKISIRSICHNDINFLFEWFNQTTNYSYNDLGLDIESISVFVSHSRTMYSHLFMIAINKADVGLIGYNVFDDEAIVNLEIYNKEKITEAKIDQTLDLIFRHITETYGSKQFQSIIFSDDNYTKKILLRNGFVFVNDDYEFAVSFEDVKKGSLFQKQGFNNPQ